MTSHSPPLKKEEFKSSTHCLQRLTISVLLEELWKSVVAEEACGTPKESVPAEDKTFPVKLPGLCVFTNCILQCEIDTEYPAVQLRH